MPRNVEVKVKVDSLVPIRRCLRLLAASGPVRLTQTDTYFAGKPEAGRLKLRAERTAGDARFELIGYRRPDRQVRTSAFEIAALGATAARAVGRALGRALGVRVVVSKRRELWLIGRDRIHLDSVWGLGKFLEIEAAVGSGARAGAEARARRRLDAYLADLGLSRAERIPGSYADLRQPAGPRSRRAGGRGAIVVS